MVVDNDYERRVYHSLDSAAKHLGWANANADLRVYRLDVEATTAANRDLAHLVSHGSAMASFIKGGVMDWKAHKAAALAIMKRWW